MQILQSKHPVRINLGVLIGGTLSLVINALSNTCVGDEVGDFFEARVRPVLVKNCFECHTNTKKGGLRLDSRAGILKGGNSGAAIVVGQPDKSLLVRAVKHSHSRLRMPPGSKLADRQIASLEKWIKDGAVWPETPDEFFRNQVRPLLKTHCLKCHADKPKGKFRVDTRTSLLAGGKRGPAISVDNPSESLLLQVLRHTSKPRMPPGGKLAEKEIAVFEKWVRLGAPWSGAAIVEGDEYVITAEQKSHWAYQPVKVVAPPRHEDTVVQLKRAGIDEEAISQLANWKTNPIDRFLLSTMASQGVIPNRRATHEVLLRRAFYDLTGLPPYETLVGTQPPKSSVHRLPSAADFRQLNSDQFAQLVTELLATKQYGERWGRHWLDLVRYADTAGDASDFPVPEAYKYRNYVIDSFNKDKPYDQFLKEQIAGDLLPFQSDDQRWEQTIGTGYIAISRRIGVSPHGLRHITIEDTLDNLGKAFLGLTIGCARCHDHKFDAIPTSDYYALYGIFDSSVYPHAGAEHKPWRQDFVYRIGKENADRLLKQLRADLEEWNRKERVALELYRDFQRKRIIDPNNSRARAWQHVLAVRKARRPYAEKFPNLEIAYAIVDGDAKDAHIQRGGSPRSEGPIVRRGFLQILGGEKLAENTIGSGRLQLANWIANKKNPLTARVIVNRVWQHHFGTGLVATPNDFGVRGARPTHPALLDFLANWLMANGWSVKAMHRLIMSSQAYQMASVVTARTQHSQQVDPDNRLYWRANRRRLDAEQLRDALLTFSNQLDYATGGRHPFDHRLTYFYRQHEPFVGHFETNKRSVYLMQQRIKKNEYLDLFDGPDGNVSLPQRHSTTTTLQALYFMNSKFFHDQTEGIAKRMLSESGEDKLRLNWFSRVAFGSAMAPGELEQSLRFLSSLKERLGGLPSAERDRQAWASFVRGALASNRFMFID